MPTEYRFVCPLPNGLHARPASMLARVVRRFRATVTLSRAEPDARAVDARSVLSVVGLDLRLGDTCVASAEGPDADDALTGVREFVEKHLAGADEPELPPDGAPLAPARLPVGLRRLGVPHATGRAVSPGIGVGAAVILDGLALPEDARNATPRTTQAELDAARSAIESVRQDLLDRAEQAGAGTEHDLLRAHAEIAGDPALWIEIERAIEAGNATAAQAVVEAADRLMAQLRAASSAYIRDRVVDVQDVCMQLIDRLTGGRIGAMRVVLDADSVVFADTLTANQLLAMDRRYLRGIVLGAIGETAHTVILARSFGIPCIIEVHDAQTLARPGDDAVVDGDAGFVIAPMTQDVTRYYEREHRTRKRRAERLRPLACQPATTADDRRLEIGANASSAEEVDTGVAHGADGVGLFRTEFLFLERDRAPDEDEQLRVYADAIAAAGGRPVIFRTFDIGGDKPAPYLHIPHEDNPFLGRRGLRLYPRHESLLGAQLRAILRASAGAPAGSVRVMAPMIATPAEAAWFRTRVEEAQTELREAGVAFDESMPIGVMIEVPSAAMAVDRLANHADFFSLGTNDLCQYWMAADRGNRAVADLCNPLQPSFLRLLREVVALARASGVWIGVCGEMAGNPQNIPLMIGLGLDEISVAGGQILALKARVALANAECCRALLDDACNCDEPHEVQALLAGPSWCRADRATLPILDRELIEVASDARTKEEAIKEAVDLLFVAGRTALPREIEEAVWAREETYSTGLGHTFAVPHAKTDAVTAPTLAVLRLANPVEWGSMDGKPVSTVLLLVVPASESAGGGGAGHMKVFAKLARKLMHDDFRDRLSAGTDAGTIEQCLREELELT